MVNFVFVLLTLAITCQRPTKSTPIELLPGNMDSIQQTIHLVLTEDNIKNNIFTGSVTINVWFDEKLNDLTFHAKDLTVDVNSIEIATRDYTIVDTNFTINQPDDGNDFLVITSSTQLENDTSYFLSMSYSGKIGESNMPGLYKSTYKDQDGTTKYMVLTQMEQMGARRVFPCLDEPSYRAKFDISLTIPSTMDAISNKGEKGRETSEDGKSVTVSFQQTYSMAAYVVGFIVSEIKCVDGGDANWGVPTAMCSRNGTENNRALAMEVLPIAMDIMENYTTYPYSDMAMDRLKQAAVPDLAAGATFSWGIIMSREESLLVDEEESSNLDQQMVVRTVTHEVAHQWWGDLITLGWWSELFLNEGLSTYFEYQAAGDIKTEWRMMDQFVVEQLQPSLVSDSVSNSLPLSYNTTDPEELKKRFDDISYSKGGSIVRMLQHCIKVDGFNASWYSYVLKSGIANPNDLWSSFRKATEELTEPMTLPNSVLTVMKAWTYNPGYPLLYVNLSEDASFVTVSQERFLLSGEDVYNTSWYVPITYTTSQSKDFTKTETQAWLKKNLHLKIELDQAEWILLNNQQVGYYRVNYDGNLLGKIQEVLSDEVTMAEVDEMARSTLVDDQMNLARAGKRPYGEVLDFLTFLKNDNSYFSWYSAFENFKFLLKRIGDNSVKEHLKTYILDNMSSLLKAVPLDSDKKEDQIYTLGQVLANTWACDLGDKDCLNTSLGLFLEFVEDDTKKVNPNLRSIVYCNGLRQSNNASGHFNFLYDKYKTAFFAAEQVKILKALGCINDAGLRREFLEKALTEEIRIQNIGYVFSSVYSNNEDGVDDVLSFIADKHADFETRFGGDSELISLITTIADLFTTEDQIDQLTAIAENLTPDVKFAAETAVSMATENLKTTNQLDETLKNYFNLGSNSATRYHLTWLALTVVVLFSVFNR